MIFSTLTDFDLRTLESTLTLGRNRDGHGWQERNGLGDNPTVEIGVQANAYRVLFEQDSRAMWVYDAQTLAVVDANPAALGFYGYSQPAFLSLKSTQLLTDAPTPQHRKADGSLLAASIQREPVLVQNRSYHLMIVASTQPASSEFSAQIQQASQRLQKFSLRLMEIQETERRQFASALHDKVGQEMTALKLELQLAQDRLPPAQRDQLAGAQRQADRAFSRVRELSRQLRPMALDDLGLLAAIFSHLDHLTETSPCRVDFHHSGLEGRRFSAAVETIAFRILKESLQNCQRHSGAARAALHVQADTAALHIEVEDHGVGFDASHVLASHSFFGLACLQQAAHSLGGEFFVQSSPGKGARVTASLPLTTGIAWPSL